MRKKILIILFFCFGFLFSTSSVNAQSCSGTATVSYTKWGCSQTNTCVILGPATASGGCSFSGNVNNLTCQAVVIKSGSGCSVNSGVCTPSDGVDLTGNGCSVSGGCNSNGNCRASGLTCCSGQSYSDVSCSTGIRCGPASGGGGPGGSGPLCTDNGGDCFTGISGCGDVGRDNGSGSCSNGGFCCNPKGSGGVYFNCSDSKPAGCKNEGEFCGANCGANGNPGCCGGLYNSPSGICGCPAAPSCTIRNSPQNAKVAVGRQISLLTSVTRVSAGNSVSRVTYNSNNQSAYSVTSPDNSSPFLTTITGITEGTGNVIASGVITTNFQGNISSAAYCSSSSNITVVPFTGFWQAIGGDVITNGDLYSSIPAGSKLILDDAQTGFPGNAIIGGNTSLNKTNISIKGWNANTKYLGRRYDFKYFNSIVPSSVIFNNLPPVISSADLNSGTISPDGYYWYKANGDLTLTSDVVISGNRKIILFVGSGDFNIDGKINIQNRGQGFFMALVEGDINVNSTLTSIAGTPAIEGLYGADGAFSTGDGDVNLHVRGSVVAWGTVSLQRNLAVDNDINPGEIFEYAPDLTLLFPRSLVQDKVNWKEVAP